MKYIDADKLIAEIERLEELNRERFEKGVIPIDTLTARGSLLLGLKDFINSLPEDKPSEDLEKVAEKYTKDSLKNLGAILRVNVSNAFKDGAQWQKKQQPASGNSEKPNNHAEWSDEDEKMRLACIDIIEHFPLPHGVVIIGPWKGCIDWLKSLREKFIKEDEK